MRCALRVLYRAVLRPTFKHTHVLLTSFRGLRMCSTCVLTLFCRHHLRTHRHHHHHAPPPSLPTNTTTATNTHHRPSPLPLPTTTTTVTHHHRLFARAIFVSYRHACKEAIKFIEDHMTISTDDLPKDAIVNVAKTSMCAARRDLLSFLTLHALPLVRPATHCVTPATLPSSYGRVR